jgi:hypothetical protein
MAAADQGKDVGGGTVNRNEMLDVWHERHYKAGRKWGKWGLTPEFPVRPLFPLTAIRR